METLAGGLPKKKARRVGLTVFVEKPRNEEDVMHSREESEGEHRDVNGRQVVAGSDARLGREHNYGDRDNLHNCAYLARQRRLETAEAGHHVDGSGTNQDEN